MKNYTLLDNETQMKKQTTLHGYGKNQALIYSSLELPITLIFSAL